MVFRTGQAELYRPTIEPQDYEMVEFFIKRLKLWMGITKAKEVGSTMAVMPFIGRIKLTGIFYCQYQLLNPHIPLPF